MPILKKVSAFAFKDGNLPKSHNKRQLTPYFARNTLKTPYNSNHLSQYQKI